MVLSSLQSFPEQFLQEPDCPNLPLESGGLGSPASSLCATTWLGVGALWLDFSGLGDILPTEQDLRSSLHSSLSPH